MIVYIHTLMLIVLGAVLNESGIKITSYYFWLIIALIFGILLTYDMIIDLQNNPPEKKDEDKEL